MNDAQIQSAISAVEGILSGGSTGAIIKAAVLVLGIVVVILLASKLNAVQVAEDNKQTQVTDGQETSTTGADTQTLATDADNADNEIDPPGPAIVAPVVPPPAPLPATSAPAIVSEIREVPAPKKKSKKKKKLSRGKR
jgi:hypothetical protein